MQFMGQKGVTPELLKKQWDLIKTSAGDDATQISHVAKMFELNPHGAVQMWDMLKNAKDFSNDKWLKKVEALKNNNEYKSDSALLRDTLNTISTKLVGLGKLTFDEKEMPILQKASGHLEDIWRKYVGEEKVINFKDKAIALQNEMNLTKSQSDSFSQDLSRVFSYENNQKKAGDRGVEAANNFKDIINRIQDFSKIDADITYQIRKFAEEFTKSVSDKYMDENEFGKSDDRLSKIVELLRNARVIIEY